ncbi:hypothetical protein C8Q78DRAFT_982605 [Trametes maxima]|nr:hypothetical protein C8Q78DRAFT_985841 [Trametes maxima]KAI0667344.1 hypothetical protein C8Q78DRAFT_982605 [Trametes maxima]
MLGDEVPEKVQLAAANYRQASAKHAKRRRTIVHQCRLDISGDSEADKQKRSEFLAKCQRVVVSERHEPYPPPQHWVVENAKVDHAWDTWCKKHTIRDARNETHWEKHRISKRKLNATAGADESVLFYDPNGKLIAFVIRDFCPNQEIVDTIAKDVQEGCLYKRSVRVSGIGCSLDDPGKIAHSGFTSGNRKDINGFGWARNLRYARHKNDPDFSNSLEHRESSSAAFFWNMARGSLPDEVIHAYTNYLQEHALPRMAPGKDDFAPRGEYTIRVPSDDPLVPEEISFEAVPRAPPSAMYTFNYARRIHRERCPQRWMFSWTLARPKGPSNDGNFFIPGYGIKIAASANSCVGWLPGEWHGTSLRDCDPNSIDKVALEVGLSFQISATLATRWRQYCESEFDPDILEKIREELSKEVEEELDEEGEDWSKDEGEVF